MNISLHIPIQAHIHKNNYRMCTCKLFKAITIRSRCVKLNKRNVMALYTEVENLCTPVYFALAEQTTSYFLYTKYIILVRYSQCNFNN